MKHSRTQEASDFIKKQRKQKRHSLLWMLVIILNSFVYACALSALRERAGLWGFAGYVFLMIFIPNYLALFPKISRNLPAILCIFLTVLLTFTTYLMASFPFLSAEFFLFAGMQIMESIGAVYAYKLSVREDRLIKSELRLHASKEDIAAYMTYSNDEAFRSLFHSMTAIMFACIALIISYGAALFVRHTEVGNNTCLYLFIASEVVFMILDMMKFVFYRQFSFIRCVAELLAEGLFMGLYFYLNSTVYRQSSQYFIFMLLPPLIALIPFANSSSQIAKKYIQAANEKAGKAPNE